MKKVWLTSLALIVLVLIFGSVVGHWKYKTENNTMMSLVDVFVNLLETGDLEKFKHNTEGGLRIAIDWVEHDYENSTVIEVVSYKLSEIKAVRKNHWTAKLIITAEVRDHEEIKSIVDLNYDIGFSQSKRMMKLYYIKLNQEER